MDVMIVDGDPLLRGLLADALQELGMTIGAFSRADEALSSPDALPPRLLICESSGEGEIDGVTLATLAHERWPRLAVIYLQAEEPGASSAITGYQLRAREYVVRKPFRLRDLLAAILAALERGQGTRPREAKQAIRPDSRS